MDIRNAFKTLAASLSMVVFTSVPVLADDTSQATIAPNLLSDTQKFLSETSKHLVSDSDPVTAWDVQPNVIRFHGHYETRGASDGISVFIDCGVVNGPDGTTAVLNSYHNVIFLRDQTRTALDIIEYKKTQIAAYYTTIPPKYNISEVFHNNSNKPPQISYQPFIEHKDIISVMKYAGDTCTSIFSTEVNGKSLKKDEERQGMIEKRQNAGLEFFKSSISKALPLKLTQ